MTPDEMKELAVVQPLLIRTCPTPAMESMVIPEEGTL